MTLTSAPSGQVLISWKSWALGFTLSYIYPLNKKNISIIFTKICPCHLDKLEPNTLEINVLSKFVTQLRAKINVFAGHHA